MKIIAGSHNLALAQNVSKQLNAPLVQSEINKFPNGEFKIYIKENLSSEEVIIINSLSHPTHENIFQLILLADAAKRVGAEKITALIPWLAYSPQDKVFREGEPLSSKTLIAAIENTPIDNFILLDLHSNLVLDYFTKQAVELTALPLFTKFAERNLNLSRENWYVVALDKGSLKRSTMLAESLGLHVKSFTKHRDRETGEITYTKFPKELDKKNVILIDDYTSTGSTLVKASNYLKENGVEKCLCFLTHTVTNEGVERVLESNIDKLITTTSIPSEDIAHDKLTVLDISPVFSEYLQTL